MAISRNAFQSLVESVQEATSAPSVTASTSGKGKVRVSSGRGSVSDIMQGIANGTINWGDASIGGAMNAAELSQWLAGQMDSGKPSVGVTPNVDVPDAVSGSGSNFGTTTGGGKTKKPSSGKPGLSTSAGAESGVVGSRGRNPMTSTSTGGSRKTPSNFDMAIRPPETSTTSSGASSTSSGKSSKSSKPKTKSRVAFGSAGAASSRSGGAASRASATRTVADSVDLSDLVDALSMIVEANRPYIPPNLSGAALSQYLHNLSQGGLNLGVETGASGYRASRHTSTRRGGNKRPTTTGGGGATINTGGGIGGMGGGVSSVGLGEANRPYIPPNLSGAALSHYLNSLSQGGLNLGVETGASGYRANSAASRLTSTRRRNKRPTTTGGGGTTINTGGGIGAMGGGMGGGVSSVGLGEDFDILDEILAEGLELYGEDGLAEILADFAETGEMSQELADLLGAE